MLRRRGRWDLRSWAAGPTGPGSGPDRAALGLFLPRNPQARVQVAAQREQTARSLAGYIAEHLAHVGGRLRKSESALARLLIATHEGVTLAGRIDGELYRSYLQLVMANVEPAADGGWLSGESAHAVGR
ncbi:hypothetical protein ACIHDR_41770 [Nocardia sp. NPDC052278]|uniref:hypothetical protein n=1 Tax=unclassified Nocardia TaxID=2637762 RepID=UPI0036BC8E20